MAGLLDNDRLKTDKSIKPIQHSTQDHLMVKIKKKEKKNTTGNIYYISRGGWKPEIKFLVEFLLVPGVNNT